VERRRLERLRSGEMEARATESVLEGLAAEVIDGRGVALVLRPHESASAVS
jgi:intracellular multiplication protein IcmB